MLGYLSAKKPSFFGSINQPEDTARASGTVSSRQKRPAANRRRANIAGRKSELSLPHGEPRSAAPLRVGDATIASNSVCWLAGPPFVESVSQINAAASSLARLGGKFLRSRAYWPEAKDRDFQQHLISGLEVLRTAGLKHGLYVVSEIISPRDFALTAEYCDILEVHPELILNSAFMREAAKSGKTVMLPRHPMITVNQFIRVIKKFEDYGASRILLAENGARGHLSDQLFDLSAVVTLRLATAHPILVDCCRLTGSPSYAFNLAAAAITAGADGIIAEFENHGVRVKSYRGSLSAENIQEMMSRADALKHTLNALRHTHYAER